MHPQTRMLRHHTHSMHDDIRPRCHDIAVDNPIVLLYTLCVMELSIKRKTALALCVFVLALCLFLPRYAAVAAPDEPASSVNSYLLADLDTGEIIFANKPDERVNPASVTKIMTALVLLEQVPDLSVKVTVGKEIYGFGQEASMMGLIEYEEISYLDLLYGMMLKSGNDAAATVAVNVGGSIEGFADLMNAKAQELGMANSHFVNPHGMTDENHYTTTADLFKLVCACMKYETFVDVVDTPSYTTAPTNKAQNGHALETTNRLISDKAKYASYNYAGAIGIKTGSTSAAKGCLVAAAHRNDHTLIAIFLGDDSYINGQKYVKRWTDAAKFFDYGFSLTRVDLAPYLAQIPLSGSIPGAQGTPDLMAHLPKTLGYWTDEDTASDIAYDGAITARIEYNESYSVFAPLKTPLGIAVYSFGDEELYRAPVFVEYQAAAAQTAGNQSTFWSRTLHILLWTLALLICLALLFFVLIVPLIRRKQRMPNPSRRTAWTTRDEIPLREENPSDVRRSRRMQTGARAYRNPPASDREPTGNVRVLRSYRRTGRVTRIPPSDDGDTNGNGPKR